MTKRKPGKSIPNEARHTVQRLLRLRPDEDAAVRAVATARGVPVSRAVGELALVAGVDRAGLLARVAALRESLAAIVRCLEEEARDGIREEHGDVVHFDGCAYEKIAVVTISGAWHGPALPEREPLTVTMGKAAWRCFVDYQDDAFLILRGERVAGEP